MPPHGGRSKLLRRLFISHIILKINFKMFLKMKNLEIQEEISGQGRWVVMSQVDLIIAPIPPPPPQPRSDLNDISSLITRKTEEKVRRRVGEDSLMANEFSGKRSARNSPIMKIYYSRKKTCPICWNSLQIFNEPPPSLVSAPSKKVWTACSSSMNRSLLVKAKHTQHPFPLCSVWETRRRYSFGEPKTLTSPSPPPFHSISPLRE